MSRRVVIAVLVVVAAGLAVGGLWTTERVASSPEAELRQRIDAYWKHRRAGEGAAATRFLLVPESSRQDFPEDFYQNEKKAIEWTDAEVETVEIEEGRAHVAVRVAYTYTDPRFSGIRVRKRYAEEWVRVGGEWLRRPGDVGAPASSASSGDLAPGLPRGTHEG